MKRKIFSLMLAAALVLGLAVPALAAGQTFSDVPSSYWGYADIEAVAEAGLMNGTGGGAFSPAMKVSVAQFLTLLGRLVFPDVKTEGSDWFGPYVTAAKDAGLLNGTQVDTNNVEAEISRYDMAVILRAAAKKLGVAEKSAQSSEVKDFGVIPNMYTEAVLAVYGMGLIKGDQAGNFNGSNTMMRAEVATVIMRLKKSKSGSSATDSSTTTDHSEEDALTKLEKRWNNYVPVSTYDPDSVECVQGERLRIDRSYLPPDTFNGGYVHLEVGETLQLTVCQVPAGYGYTKDNLNERTQHWLNVMEPESNRYCIEKFSNGIWTSSNPEVATVDQNGFVTVVGDGQASITVEVPVIYYHDWWATDMDSIAVSTRAYYYSLYE